ncbi:RecX family transcriptional regulator [Chloroflexota bacterium]
MDRKITALKAQKRNSQRINVHLDGEFAFGLSRYAAAWLQVGQELSSEKIKELQEIDAQEIAYQRALNFISYRPRAEAEVRKNLKKHDTPDEVILDVLDRLRQSGLVDDAAFAQTWVENRSTFRPRGRRALATELRQKGVGSETIDETLCDLDEDDLAYQAALKQSRKYEGLDWHDFRKKMSAFLARRGFSYGVAKPVIEQVWSEIQA